MNCELELVIASAIQGFVYKVNIVMITDNFEISQYSPVRDYKYATYFEEVQYNGKTLTADERKEFVAVIDETISDYSDGLPLIKDILDYLKDHIAVAIIILVFIIALVATIIILVKKSIKSRRFE